MRGWQAGTPIYVDAVEFDANKLRELQEIIVYMKSRPGTCHLIDCLLQAVVSLTLTLHMSLSSAFAYLDMTRFLKIRSTVVA